MKVFTTGVSRGVWGTLYFNFIFVLISTILPFVEPMCILCLYQILALIRGRQPKKLVLVMIKSGQETCRCYYFISKTESVLVESVNTCVHPSMR